MTDSELIERMTQAIEDIRLALEARGGLLELEKKPDLRWSGLARLPNGKLLIQSQKTGRSATPDSKKAVTEALADLTLEGRFIARVLIHQSGTDIEFPGGARRPLDHSGIGKMLGLL